MQKVFSWLFVTCVAALLVLGIVGTGMQEADAGKALANGMRCSFNSDCASNYCSFKQCKSRSGKKELSNGSSCTFNSDCLSGYCSFKTCKSRSGGKALGNGMSCTFNSDCASKYCSFKKCKAR
jgi:hypothetical protein